MAPQTVAADDERIAALVAKKKKLAEDIKKARKERARRIREAKAAEAAAVRKKDDARKYAIGGMLTAAIARDDKWRAIAIELINSSAEPTNVQKAELLDYVSAAPAAKKLVDEAIASGTSPWTDEDAKEMKAIRDVAAAHPDRRYLTLPEYGEPGFDAEKDAVKALGAKYDRENKAWYIPAADLPAREKEFEKWL